MTELWPLPSHPLGNEVREFVEARKLAERYRALDRAPEFPRGEFRAMGEAGLLGLTVSPKQGGRGLRPAQAAAVLHELAYRSGTTFAKLSLQPEFCSVLGERGSPPVLERWYRPLLRGELLVGNQITEPTAGSDAGRLNLVAEPTDAGYRLTGTKSEAAFAADAEAAIVYGRRPGSEGSAGISAFVVAQDLPGIDRRVEPADLGERWQRRGTVRYDEVEVSRGDRLGEEGAAFSYLRDELERERALLAAIYLGVARASWEETVRHVAEREAFGQPLSERQAVAFPLVEDLAALSSSWELTVRALERLEARSAGGPATALAKVTACRAALACLDHAVQFHGGAGYSSRLPFEQRWRDVRSGSIAHGSDELLEAIVARHLWPLARR